MAYLDLEKYERIMSRYNPIFYLFVILFFLKEFSLLFSWGLFVDFIPDLIFFLVFLGYAILYIGPMFKPEWVEGYEVPTHEKDDDETKELTEEEKELRELERISL